jgi:hypothetical protein
LGTEWWRIVSALLRESPWNGDCSLTPSNIQSFSCTVFWTNTATHRNRDTSNSSSLRDLGSLLKKVTREWRRCHWTPECGQHRDSKQRQCGALEFDNFTIQWIVPQMVVDSYV